MPAIIRDTSAGGVPAFVPALERHETLYSLCSAVHAINHTRSAAWTARALLGASHAMRQHEWPRSLAELNALAPQAFGDPLQLLRRHTVAGFYLPFLAMPRQLEIASLWGASCQPNGPRALGAVSRTLSTDHPLKWCEQCVAADIETFGRSCWHTNHQFPTTYWCLAHFGPLRWVAGHGKRWLVPGSAPGVTITGGPETALQTLACVGAALRNLQAVDLAGLRQSTVDRWLELGVIHSRARVSEIRLNRWFRSTDIARALPILPCGLSALANGDWIRSQIWRHKLSHAVRWVVLWSALGWASSTEASERFLRACSGIRVTMGEAPRAFVAAMGHCISYRQLMEELQVSRSDIVRWFEAYPELRRQWRLSRPTRTH